MKLRFLLLLHALLLVHPPVTPAATDRAKLIIVLVIDGLRPDSITQEVTPNLQRLKTRATWYPNAHSVFPTVTRVNTASISTGTLPSKHGIVSNALYVPSISSAVLSNGEYEHLLSLGKHRGGRIVAPKTLGEYLQDAGIRYMALSSGSTGNAVLLNPTAPYGSGSLINPGFEKGGRVAFPDSLNAALLERFGKPKPDDADGAMLWVERVLREYVLDGDQPQMIVNWMGRTDSAQHRSGVGSPEGVAALRLVDEQIGLLLRRLQELKLENSAHIIVTSDHGFDHEPAADVLAPIRQSGFFEGDIVVDAEGGATLLYIKDHDAEKISRVAASLQGHPDTNAIFVRGKRPTNAAQPCAPDAVKGFVPGTFALELAGQCPASDGPDLIVTHRWSDAPNPFGVPGTQIVNGGPDSAKRAPRNGHGGLNPYVTRSTLLAAGPAFAAGKTAELPAGNQDITPTVLTLFGLQVPETLDGRVLSEAMKNSRDARPPKSSRRQIQVSSGAYCAQLDVSYAGKHKYLNSARRCGAQ